MSVRGRNHDLCSRWWRNKNDTVSSYKEHLHLPFCNVDDTLTIHCALRINYHDRLFYIAHDEIHVAVIRMKNACQLPITTQLDKNAFTQREPYKIKGLLNT